MAAAPYTTRARLVTGRAAGLRLGAAASVIWPNGLSLVAVVAANFTLMAVRCTQHAKPAVLVRDACDEVSMPLLHYRGHKRMSTRLQLASDSAATSGRLLPSCQKRRSTWREDSR
jgi:hypothetical protein